MTYRKPWYGYWRATEAPAVALPLGARSVGRAEVQPGWRHNTGIIHWINVYWGVAGEAGLLVNGERCRIRAGELVIHLPGSAIAGYPVTAAGAYRWLTLDGPLALQTLRAFALPPWRALPVGPCPTELFDELEAAVRTVTAAAEYEAGALAVRILAQAAAGWRGGDRGGGELDPAVAAALAKLEADYADPDLTVADLAAAAGLHRSRLSRLFTAAVGLPPSTYLQRLRLQKAVSLLRDPQLAIAEVARACGFADPAYFSRCVTRAMGRSPSQLRRSL